MCDRCDIDALEVQPHLTGLEGSQLLELLGEGAQPDDLALEGSDQLDVAVAVAELLGERSEHRQRRAQLVREVGDQGAARTLELPLLAGVAQNQRHRQHRVGHRAHPGRQLAAAVDRHAGVARLRGPERLADRAHQLGNARRLDEGVAEGKIASQQGDGGRIEEAHDALGVEHDHALAHLGERRAHRTDLAQHLLALRTEAAVGLLREGGEIGGRRQVGPRLQVASDRAVMLLLPPPREAPGEQRGHGGGQYAGPRQP